jgi:hypothetical protein
MHTGTSLLTPADLARSKAPRQIPCKIRRTRCKRSAARDGSSGYCLQARLLRLVHGRAPPRDGEHRDERNGSRFAAFSQCW